MPGCAAYFDFVSPVEGGRPEGLDVTEKRVDRLDCRHNDPDHDGKHEADAPEHIGPGTVTWG